MTATSSNPLDATVDHLLDVGWCSDGPFGDNGEKCVLLALNTVCRKSWVAIAALSDVLRSWGRDPRVVAFNDDPSTTFADIQLLCKHAAARYDELVAS